MGCWFEVHASLKLLEQRDPRREGFHDGAVVSHPSPPSAHPTRLCWWQALLECVVSWTGDVCEWMIQGARAETLSLAWRPAPLLSLGSSDAGLEGVGTIWTSSFISAESSSDSIEWGGKLSSEGPFQG
ncbi:LOW QUALITY PROTEIN: saitohin [Trichechus manatus latirostris]|uniref:LOW QUALITY PROTEIN: saitohin n=1 Tax=Trichechus manatus latirostris TaxID=127582 RepID=A0A2Y9FYB3_TRIMA|nr:LOW QUALITY PROTEIN: saitohin [Trichechus manatus latirostris]